MTRALIVDDKPENLYLLRALLQGHGYEVDEARHGAEALVKARQAPPQIVVSDLLMPVMDGYTLLRHWKVDERLKAVPFVVYTATYTEPKDEQLALDLGADAFILKPAEPELFMARIHEVLARQERGELISTHAPGGDEKIVLKEYSEALVRKLEEKALLLEQSNRALREDVARREAAEAERESLLAEKERAGDALLSILEDQREAVAAQRASEARLRNVIDGVGPQMFVGLLSLDGTLMEANRPALAAAGLKIEDVIGKKVDQTYWFAYSETVQQQLRAAVERAARGEASRYDVEIRVGEGQFVTIDFSLQPFRDDKGEVVFLVPSANVITERKRAENALRASQARLEALTRRLLEVQETERRSIARELHDEVGGVLTAVKLNLQSLRGERVGKAAGRAEAALADGLALVDGAIQSVRALSLDLRPAVLDDLGLIPALRWYCERQAKRARIPIELALEAVDLKSAPQLESACFRIVQESVTNALRHAKARRIQVALRRDDGSFVLEIADDGGGFEVAAARKRGLAGESSGLLGMEERASLLGGRFTIDAAPGAGTRVWAEFAVPEGGFA